MNNSVLELVAATVRVTNGPYEQKTILNECNLQVAAGDFITILGGNGAGKSTLFNSISGTNRLSSGAVLVNGNDVTKQKEEERASFLARVFQDPKLGTAPRMTVAENLMIAYYRGQKRRLVKRPMQTLKPKFKELCQAIDNGLEHLLDVPCNNLSGGQRQALSLLMATLTKPALLLLDEHTAALDPKTSENLMQFTAKRIAEEHLTCLMITHRMEDALRFGNRLIVLDSGQIRYDFRGQEKEQLRMADLLSFFEG